MWTRGRNFISVSCRNEIETDMKGRGGGGKKGGLDLQHCSSIQKNRQRNHFLPYVHSQNRLARSERRDIRGFWPHKPRGEDSIKSYWADGVGVSTRHEEEWFMGGQYMREKL